MAPPPSSKPANSDGGKQKKKKWSKGKQKEKVNNMVLFDQDTYDKLLSEAPKYKRITRSVLADRLRSKRKKINEEEIEAVASNKAVRSKRKKKMMMMNKETEAVVVVSTSDKVRNYLSHDTIIFILSNLPLKSLKRFECVCKLWATLFQDSYFKTLYANNVISNNNNHYDDTYLVHENYIGRRYFYMLPNQRFEDRVKIDWPSSFERSSIDILGATSINGILCLNQRCTRQLGLWNPTTGEFHIIPYGLCEYLPPNRQPSYSLHGFGYDHVTNDYKVIQFVDSYLGGEDEDEEYEDEDRSSYETFWMIYSLRSKSWRKLDLNIPNRYNYLPHQHIGVYTNGVCHWWARTHDEDNEEYLLSFNFSNELMFTTPRPSYLDVRICDSFKFVSRCLVLLNESIALISTELETATLHISILGELGIRESWTKLLTVTCLPPFEYPIGVGNFNNKVLVRKNDNRIAWIDLNTKMMEELDLRLKNDVTSVYVGRHKKSFLPIGGMNN